MNRSLLLGFVLGVFATLAGVFGFSPEAVPLGASPDAPQPRTHAETRTYDNTLTPIKDPKPLLADFPEFVEPVRESRRFEAPRLVDDAAPTSTSGPGAARTTPAASSRCPTASARRRRPSSWSTPGRSTTAGAGRRPSRTASCDFCTPEKNHLAARHTREVIDPFLKSLRGKVAFVMYSLPGPADPIRKKVYRSFAKTPTADERAAGREGIAEGAQRVQLQGAASCRTKLTLSTDKPVIDYFRQFPGLDAGPRYNGEGFWELPIPVSTAVTVEPDDVVIFDAEGYAPLRDFLKKNGVRHVLLTGYATDMCFCRTTAGYENLSKDFNVFLVGDATLATFPANDYAASSRPTRTSRSRRSIS